MSPEEIKAQVAAERAALLAEDTNRKEDIELSAKAEKYAKGEIKGLQSKFSQAGIKVTAEQAVQLQQLIFAEKLEWLRKEKAPESTNELMEGWTLAS